jgi:multidrug resistance efflux pump
MNKTIKILLSSTVLLLAVAVLLFKYWSYVTNPWTRNGQVQAHVIQITSRVTGPVVNLPIRDNQLVKAGDLLFEIDRRTFEAAVKKAEAELQRARVTITEAADELNRAQRIINADPGAMPQAELVLRKNTLHAKQAAAVADEAVLISTQLDFEFTQVRAPVDGYITNLNLRIGSQAVANQPVLALIDSNSFWIDGYFREDRIGGIREGDRAIVTLMSYPNRPLEGRVDSLGWGIAQDDGSTGYNLLPNISPTFEWIRLAQRIPVRIYLIDLPEDIRLQVGTTASVLVMTGSNDGKTTSPIPALPSALQ